MNFRQKRSARKTGNEGMVQRYELKKLWVPISGSMLQEKALHFAKDLGNTEFKA